MPSKDAQSDASRFDAIIIGTGQAGVPLAQNLTGRGWRVAIAEGGAFGGTCVNNGCTPTKTMIASARVAHLARRGAEFGVRTGEISIDFAAVMARKDKIVGDSRGGIEKAFDKNKLLTVYRAFAQFEASAVGVHRVRVGDDVIEAPRVYLNTGARATIPPIPGLRDVDFLDNQSLLDLKSLPRHLIIIGGGYIGLEFAQAFRRFGSDVTIIEPGAHVMAREDADIATAARDVLLGEGIDIRLKTRAAGVVQRGGDIVVTTDGGTEIVGTQLLVAVGRTPNSDKLGLDAAGVVSDDKGFITVDDGLQTNVPGIWALGDVNGRGAFTHTSYNDYEIVVDNLDGGTRKVSDRIPVYAMFIDPPLARVGMSEGEARASGLNVLLGTLQMRTIGRAKERGETAGLIKVLIDADTERFLGASALGIDADEWVHGIIDLMYADAPYTVMKNAVHIHPTISELLPTLLGKLKPLAST
ncbi:MAG: FAD-containing oxidoreductase [Chloroflexota bacterium]|nr:FAD-containing oxidoreductase [Chloroflexota bacterium]